MVSPEAGAPTSALNEGIKDLPEQKAFKAHTSRTGSASVGERREGKQGHDKGRVDLFV